MTNKNDSVPVLVAVAWPYASGSRHLGHLAGAYLPADVFARFQRLAGNEVLMVSGSDVHGTPITVRADSEGTTPDEIVGSKSCRNYCCHKGKCFSALEFYFWDYFFKFFVGFRVPGNTHEWS